MKLLRVALALPLMRFFDYLLPDDLAAVPYEIGCRVLVPFGNRKVVGIVVGFPDESEIDANKLKPIIAYLDKTTIFNTALWRLLHWGAEYYQYALGEVLFSALPIKLRNGESAVSKSQVFLQITEAGKRALEQGELKRAKTQQQALDVLLSTRLEKGNNEFSSAIWSQLKTKQFVEEVEEILQPIHWKDKLQGLPIVESQNRLTLNKQQALALSQLLFKPNFNAWLLEGVTGSGKTEIYLQFIEEILKQGKQVLVLVPEIGLTPQTVQRFQARFNVPVEVLHSNLNDTQRLRVWQKMKSAESAVLIGTRSALFTQFADLGLIIIDEEHDSSFKQQDGGWRYHARDLAIVYAHQLDVPIVLGSATPSLESLHNVKQGKYHHIVLTQRAGTAQPLQQQVIDLKTQRVEQGLSGALLKKMATHLQQGNQVLLFLNRRGFAPVLLCHECGWIASCQHCDRPYTYHQHHRVLRCHHCASQKTIPMQCEQCGSTNLITTGIGTEQLEQVLQKHFPQYGITRIDSDSTERKGALENHLQAINQGRSQILIGTQILAKGHHFPNVTLVAIVNVDSGLFSVDFRAEERLAQLYVQVSGRAGRGEKQGEVVLQTHYPDHPLLQTLLAQGYSAFAKQILDQRQRIGLPPFSAQAMFKAQHKDSSQAEQTLQQIAHWLQHYRQQHNLNALQILGPQPAPFAKRAGQFRWQLLVQYPSKIGLKQILMQCRQQIENHPQLQKLRYILDVDPLDLG